MSNNVINLVPKKKPVAKTNPTAVSVRFGITLDLDIDITAPNGEVTTYTCEGREGNNIKKWPDTQD